MSEMVTRAAKAFIAGLLEQDECTWLNDKQWPKIYCELDGIDIELAMRAVIKAMREPTQKMTANAVRDADEERFGPHEARECWRSMLDGT